MTDEIKVYVAPIFNIATDVFQLHEFLARLRQRGIEEWREKKQYRLRYVVISQEGGRYHATVLFPEVSTPGVSASIRDLVRTCVRDTNGVGVLVGSETWVLNSELRKATTAREDWSQIPGRREELLFLLELKGHEVETWKAEIHRDPDRIDELEKVTPVVGGGNLTSWFEKEEACSPFQSPSN